MGDVITMERTSGKVGTVNFKLVSFLLAGNGPDIIVSHSTGFNLGIISAEASGSKLFVYGDTATEMGGDNRTVSVANIKVPNSQISFAIAANLCLFERPQLLPLGAS